MASDSPNLSYLNSPATGDYSINEPHQLPYDNYDPQAHSISIGLGQSQSYQSWYASHSQSQMSTSSGLPAQLIHSASFSEGTQNDHSRAELQSQHDFGKPLTHSVSVNTGLPQSLQPRHLGNDLFRGGGQNQGGSKKYKSGFI